MRIQIIGDIAIAARPGLERLELTFRLAHVAVKVVEIAQGACLGACIGVSWIEAFVVLDKDEDAVLARFVEEVEMVFQQLCSGLGDQDVDLALDGVQGDGIVGGVGGEDCDCGTLG